MPHDVISDFLDNEPFDAAALGQALSEPDGRELLLDLLALRAVVRDDESAATTPVDVKTFTRQRRLWIAAGFAAASVVFTLGGALTMSAWRPSDAAASVTLEADVSPQPDRVVTFEPGLDWHDGNQINQ